MTRIALTTTIALSAVPAWAHDNTPVHIDGGAAFAAVAIALSVAIVNARRVLRRH